MVGEEVKIFLSFFIIFFLFTHYVGWNEESRAALTKALVEEGRVQIDNYANLTGDRAYYRGHYYSDKAPGTSFLAIPAYIISRCAPNHLKNKIKIPQPRFNATVYYFQNISIKERVFHILSVICLSVLPGTLLLILIYRICKSYTKKTSHRLLLTISFGLCTPIFPYSTVMTGNILSAFLGLLSFYIVLKLLRKELTPKYFAISGILSGFSIVVNYLMVIIFVGNLFLLLSKKLLKPTTYFFLGGVIGVLPLLIYNFLIFSNPFLLTIFHIDPSVFPLAIYQKSIYGEVIENLVHRVPVVVTAILFLPYRGLFFYFPFLLSSIIGFYYLFNKDEILTKVLLLELLLFLFVNGYYLFWIGGSSFGPRYLVPLIPFLSIPFATFLQKAGRNKHFQAALATLVLVSVLHNLFGLSTFWEGLTLSYERGVRAKADWSTNFFEVPGPTTPFLNPLYKHYFPMFLKNGPRSRILEYSLIREIPDIRDFKPMPVREIKLFTLHPFGILILKVPFLIILILLFILTLIWRKELFKISIFKKISVGLLLLVLIALLFISRLKFKDIVYDKNWHPIHVNGTHIKKERWMAKKASIFLYSPKERKVSLLFRIGTFYEPRRLNIEVNGEASEHFVTSYSATLITPMVTLKKGENVVKLKSLEGCERPAPLVNGSNDYRCLSFVIHKLSTVPSFPKYRIIFGRGWYPPEPHINWAYENSSIFIHSAQKAKAKANMTLISYYKPRKIDFYFNNILFNTFRVEPRKMNILTKTLPFKKGENIIEFISKEKCNVPAIIGRSRDKRCLSFGLFDINLISPYELVEENKTFSARLV